MIKVEHIYQWIINDTFFYIFEIKNMMKLMYTSMIGRFTRDHLRQLCSQNYEGD